jgi:hypothetical protein
MLFPTFHAARGHARGSLSRRTFLRGVGAGVALPLLDCMLPTCRRAAGGETAVAPRRLVAIHVPLGWMPQFFFPDANVGTTPTSPYLDLLADHRGRFTVFSGLSHPDVGSNHSAGQCFLTGARHPGQPSFRNSISLDQFAAERIGAATRFPSLTLAVQKHQPPLAAATLSVSRSGVFIPAETSPSRLYRSMFVAGTPAEQAATMRQIAAGRSVLDVIGESITTLGHQVGPADRSRLEQYFTSVRDLEQRMVRSIEWEQTSKPKVDAPEPQDITDHNRVFEKARLMFDMLRLALQTDSTRIISLMLDTAAVAHVPGVMNETHGLTHHGNEPDKIAELKKVEVAQTQALAYLLSSLHETTDGEGTLLDQTQVLVGSCLGNANSHSNDNLPVILAGGGFRHPGHLAFDSKRNEPLANLFLSMLQRLGLEADAFASSTGTLRGLDIG